MTKKITQTEIAMMCKNGRMKSRGSKNGHIKKRSSKILKKGILVYTVDSCDSGVACLLKKVHYNEYFCYFKADKWVHKC